MDHAAEKELKRRRAAEADQEPATDQTPSDEQKSSLPEIPRELPILPVRNLVVFPGTVVPLTIGREKSKRLTDSVLAGNRLLGVCTQRHEETEDPGIDDIYRIGTVAQVLKLLPMPDGSSSLLVHGIVRVGIEEFVRTDPFWVALINPHEDHVSGSLEIDALTFNARRTAERVIELSPNVPDEALQILASIEKPGPLADFLAANLSLGLAQKQELLETFDVADRLRKVTATLQNQLEILNLAQKIQTDVRTQIDKTQREYFLQEQMKAIRKELGEGDPREGELIELRRRINEASMPEVVLREAKREMERLQRISPASPENGVIRDYLEWLIEMPWEHETEDKLDLDRAAEVLDADHFGLEQIKRRILEYLAVLKLKPHGKGPILCFAGPPGVGKTSLGQSIARALGREFIRIALGGVRDEADIRGHRRTYIGAIPGRIVQEIRKAGSRNPVLMLDEMDKLGADFRGDPASALLEVLDPEQNHNFTDHYLSVPFDLSKVMFIATANYMDPVEPALRDRLEVIELPGYTTAEKTEIAKRYLVPRQLERNGVADQGLSFADDTIHTIIDGYTREAGVRNLERTIGTVCRGMAAKVARHQEAPAVVTEEHLEEYLGPARFESDVALVEGMPGVVTGLAYTPVGGEIIFIEVTSMPGRAGLMITGQIGDVMRESAQAALSLLRAHGEEWGVPIERLPEIDIHIHVPAGAIPKDGPSAGVAMLTALFTCLTGTSADPKVGMTGEITLRGLVLPIGGIKEKVLAAHRAGLKKIILPARNKPDMHEVPVEIRESLEFVFVDRVEEVLLAAIPELQSAEPEAKPKRRARRKKAAPKRTRRKASSGKTSKPTRNKRVKDTKAARAGAKRSAARRR